MKRVALKITTYILFAAALLAASMLARAAEKNNAPAAGQETSAKHKKHDAVPFNEKLTAVDSAAMTITVGNRTFAIASATRITKDGLPATLPTA